MLSYSWACDVVIDIAGGLKSFCESSGRDLRCTFVWVCCVCVNQHRVRGSEVPFEQFRDIFKNRVRDIGHLVPLLSPWKSPVYITRAWCVMELFTAIEQKCQITITMPPHEAEDMKHATMGQDLSTFWAALGTLRAEEATATMTRDAKMIQRLIRESAGGCVMVNKGAIEHLRD